MEVLSIIPLLLIAFSGGMLLIISNWILIRNSFLQSFNKRRGLVVVGWICGKRGQEPWSCALEWYLRPDTGCLFPSYQLKSLEMHSRMSSKHNLVGKSSHSGTPSIAGPLVSWQSLLLRVCVIQNADRCANVTGVWRLLSRDVWVLFWKLVTDELPMQNVPKHL